MISKSSNCLNFVADFFFLFKLCDYEVDLKQEGGINKEKMTETKSKVQEIKASNATLQKNIETLASTVIGKMRTLEVAIFGF